MPEASSLTAATVATAVGAATGAVAGPALSAFGIDGYSIGAGLLGCVVVQLFNPPEKVTIRNMVATSLGGVLVASFGAPYIAPTFAIGTVNAEHANAVASALLGGSAKPVFLIVKARFEKWFGAWLPPAGGDTKGPGDA